MSLSLIFSASYQTGNSSNGNNQSANYSLLSDMQYNCTAQFAVDGIPPYGTIKSVNVTVSGPYGSASSLRNMNQGWWFYFIYNYTYIILSMPGYNLTP